MLLVGVVVGEGVGSGAAAAHLLLGEVVGEESVYDGMGADAAHCVLLDVDAVVVGVLWLVVGPALIDNVDARGSTPEGIVDMDMLIVVVIGVVGVSIGCCCFAGVVGGCGGGVCGDVGDALVRYTWW